MANVTEREMHEAEARMQARLSAGPRAVEARYDRRTARVVLTLSSGVELALPPRLAGGLADAGPDDLSEIEITPTGQGLHFPRLDADLYVPALLQGVMGSSAWMAGELGGGGAAPVPRPRRLLQRGKTASVADALERPRKPTARPPVGQ
jgi:Protein of unknown function (DUF2442)